MADSDSDDGDLTLQRRLASSLLAAPPLGVKPKDWSAYVATQASILDSFSSSRVAFSGKGKGFVKKGLHKPKKGALLVSPSPLDSAAAGPSGRQPKLAKLAPDVEATNQLKRDISLQCFGPSSPEETPKKRKKPRRIISSSEDEEPVHVHAQAPSGKFFLCF